MMNVGGLISNEHGYSGMQGRGFFAGVSGYGFHAEYSQNGGFDWGGSTTAYLSAGNQSDMSALDGETTSMVTTDISIPTLGFNYNLGAYDVSDNGLRKAMLDEIIPILKEHPEIIGEDRIQKIVAGDEITEKDFLRIGRALRKSGYEMVEHLNGHSDGYSKTTFRKSGSMGYRNIELMSSVRDNRAYSSYNYGNNVITHLIIDWGGWKGRGY